MPFADRERQREYQRQWIARRRAEWLRANGPCCECGSVSDLEVDHKDPAQKVSHNVWSWTESRRLAELAKCQVLCASCHQKKTIANHESGFQGEAAPNAKLTEASVLEIRRLFASGKHKIRDLARRFGVKKSTVGDVVTGKKWKHVTGA